MDFCPGLKQLCQNGFFLYGELGEALDFLPAKFLGYPSISSEDLVNAGS